MSLMPPAEKCPPAYNGCMCSCHRVPGAVHVAACCAPGDGGSFLSRWERVIKGDATPLNKEEGAET